MKLKVLYFARLRERLGVAEEAVELPDGMGMVAMLLDVLRARGGVWAEQLAAGKNFRVAVNQDMAGMEAPIEDGDEVAIFPPVTGG
ncbi:molybdopterin synthase sulfur carrier subunit [Sulfuriferula plumbiphila]|uniref:Molybdopterin synthase sulfur carrier subunit n=1 Tax=Sulfuriferula plumbiphila TaxID=171865 RepID=A0A512LAJ3_9PROT|nr:molybdopterin converting factor subunit 1 [Sulfuriferula plumbiphila]BBP04930.1 molybdopterin synthase sulfur carrier subunit [Sulfuriferula plumbiphila]GEP31503.1 molybdopterin synthase sulfur carrier subunit [Sulfuriferula plumbiphila]